jgi:sugar O-acyltransferase (sialic acid O-acetyltransferase NeuD family)
MSKPLVILGAIGTCFDIADAVLAQRQVSLENGYELRGFLDDDTTRHGMTFRGAPVLGPIAAARDMEGTLFVNGIGGPRGFRVKSDLIQSLNLDISRFATIIHPMSFMSASAKIGNGTVVLANCTVCADVEIGSQVLLQPNCVIGHDARIGDFTTLAAGATVSGRAKIGRGCYVGAGAAIGDCLTLGEGAFLGTGAVQVTDLAGAGVYWGNPAIPWHNPLP